MSAVDSAVFSSQVVATCIACQRPSVDEQNARMLADFCGDLSKDGRLGHSICERPAPTSTFWRIDTIGCGEMLSKLLQPHEPQWWQTRDGPGELAHVAQVLPLRVGAAHQVRTELDEGNVVGGRLIRGEEATERLDDAGDGPVAIGGPEWHVTHPTLIGAHTR